MISIRNLTVTYENKPVLKGLNLEINHASVTALLGPSGCGKTTLLHTIAGLIKPVNGSIAHIKEPVKLGMVLQNHGLFPWKTVEENIGMALLSQSNSNKYAENKCHDLLSALDMTAYSDTFINQLSGGEKQRVAIARALISRPDILLLDEPTASLDKEAKKKFYSIFNKLCKSDKMTTLLVTHDEEEAVILADRIIYMREGQIVEG